MDSIDLGPPEPTEYSKLWQEYSTTTPSHVCIPLTHKLPAELWTVILLKSCTPWPRTPNQCHHASNNDGLSLWATMNHICGIEDSIAKHHNINTINLCIICIVSFCLSIKLKQLIRPIAHSDYEGGTAQGRKTHAVELHTLDAPNCLYNGIWQYCLPDWEQWITW